ncbi:hypothetical protein LLCRE1631_02515 [Lactococcus lactis subsp. lactis CNCM I-1631]|nr:hypothetical protein LLCRE1631_02515 [Lactococcus lactis subsp. lactis CNCM I-1631]
MFNTAKQERYCSEECRKEARKKVRIGFEKYGVEINALKTGDKYFDEDLMVLFLK